MSLNPTYAAELFTRANRAAADAIRYRREPWGAPLAVVRHRDAAELRRLARKALAE